MLKGKIICDRAYRISEIDPRLYGSFLEHMGRVIYSGIYEPDHPDADQDGFRKDVLDVLKKMGVTAIRYPGGNFVSAYHWEDGVGPKEERPRRLDLAWKSIETNEFGTNEFMSWAKKAGVTPIFTVNLGTRGMEAALQYLEYCNFPGGTRYSDLRRSHGVEEPYHIKYWCLGNEMDGEWQIGHKSAQEYGKLAAETGMAMKSLDADIELIACGSSLSSKETCPAWDLEVLEQTYDVVDYLALHQYYGGQEKGTGSFLAQSLDMEEHIRTIRSAAQVVKREKRSKKDMKFSIDEWGVWASPCDTVNQEVENAAWQCAPSISEQIYTLEDALLFADMMMVMLRNCDVIKMACQSLLTNISACIMTEPGGGLWLQTTFYPFYCFANYAEGIVLDSRFESAAYHTEDWPDVPYLDEVAVWNQESREIAVFMINKSEEQSMDITLSFRDFHIKDVIDFVGLTAENKKMTNQMQHDAVILKSLDTAGITNGEANAQIPPLSFTMLRLEADRER